MLDRVYGTLALAKRRWVERHPGVKRRLANPVLSVGNLSVGGTGKTPVVAAIAKWLIDRGERPSILSRGYKRQHQVEGVVVVSDRVRVLAGIAEAGDEPLMLARQVPGAVVCVCADRYLAGVLAERRFGCTVHVLDDGFQHLMLARDLDVIVTALGEIPNGRVLPVGRLREPIDAASRADLVIVADATEPEARGEAWTLRISQYAAMTRRLGARRWLDGGHGLDGGHRFSGAEGEITGRGASSVFAQELRPDSPEPWRRRLDPPAAIVAVAGIANPDRFFNGLAASGFNVVRTLPLPDHHPYTARDLETMARLVRETGASAVVTTEKDAVKLEALQPLPCRVAAFPLELEFDPWASVTGAIEAALLRARGAA